MFSSKLRSRSRTSKQTPNLSPPHRYCSDSARSSSSSSASCPPRSSAAAPRSAHSPCCSAMRCREKGGKKRGGGGRTLACGGRTLTCWLAFLLVRRAAQRVHKGQQPGAGKDCGGSCAAAGAAQCGRANVAEGAGTKERGREERTKGSHPGAQPSLCPIPIAFEVGIIAPVIH